MARGLLREFSRTAALLVVHRGHIADQLHHLVGVAALVVVPGDHLHKGVGQGQAGLLVEDGGAGVAQEVAGDHVLVGVGLLYTARCV